ncbi:DUF402 domain-containing protein [Salinicoccus sesuvii]|uniref:DUF402 domain-containing protein n=1 Tax=Salinicoccus sesuvii TaxID=868281 RepID=A0ABV7N5R5_9STAP
MMSLETTTISAFKYDGSLHYSWDADIIEKTEDYLLVKGRAGRQLRHYTKKQTYICPTPSLEFFSLKEGFTVNIDIHPDGDLEYYCNIALPSEYKNGQIHFVDLDVDFVKMPDADWKLMDYDEFKSNSQLFNYPDHILSFVNQSIEALEEKIKTRVFPFDGFFADYILHIRS